MTINEVISRFDKPKRITGGTGIREAYQVRCPCHKDKENSLTISLSDSGKILMRCHAGCDTEAILEAVSLSMADICGEGGTKSLSCLERLAWYYGNKYEWNDDQGKPRQGYGEGVKVIAEYPYCNEHGAYQYSKIRFEGGAIPGKLIRYYTIDRAKDEAKVCKQADIEKCLYRLPEFLKLKDHAECVYIVEGEKDCETLRKLGSGFGCCTTPGGAADWRKEYAHYFKGLKVVILRDNDEPGTKAAEKIMKDLKPFAYYVKVVCPSRLKHGDVTDYLTVEGGTADSLKRLCKEVTEVQFASWVKLDKDGAACGINTGILAETIAEHEQYIIVRNNYDDKDILLSYEKGAYRQLNKGAIKAMIRNYVPASNVTDNMLNSVANMLFATTTKVHGKAELNANYQYINLNNGLLDIRAKKLIPHNPQVLSTLQFCFDYEPKAKCPAFTNYVRDLCTKPDGSIDEDQILQVQEYLGFCLSNEPMAKIKKAMILVSLQGNSGKSVLVRLLAMLHGIERIASIKLTELKPDNKFILGNLPEVRVITCGDESNSMVEDSSIFKALTGGDAIKVEEKGRQGYSFIFRGGFIIACNGLPFFQDDKGSHIFDRLMILPCDHHITDEAKDPGLDEKLSRELPGIFNWSLEGLYRLISNNYVFTVSKSSKISKEEYRKGVDSVYRFLTELYDLTYQYDDTVSKTELEDEYYEWCCRAEREGKTIRKVERKNLSARLESYGINSGMGNIGSRHHVYVYRGLKVKREWVSGDWREE